MYCHWNWNIDVTLTGAARKYLRHFLQIFVSQWDVLRHQPRKGGALWACIAGRHALKVAPNSPQAKNIFR